MPSREAETYQWIRPYSGVVHNEIYIDADHRPGWYIITINVHIFGQLSLYNWYCGVHAKRFFDAEGDVLQTWEVIPEE